MEQPGTRSLQLASKGTGNGSDAYGQSTHAATEVVAVPVLSLRTGDSPRLNGVDKGYIDLLAETETPLPPVLVDKRTMRVIDGMHRLMAASLRGKKEIDVIFFEGSEDDVFLRAVQENVAHGLPLSQADRRAAAKRIIASHPHMSDRAIGQAAGLAAKGVAAIRKSSSDDVPQSNARVGRDGRIRPLDSGKGRQRAAELLTEQPATSLRNVARAAGISPATALDVRKRLERGEPPVPATTVNGFAGKAARARADDGADGRASRPEPQSASRSAPVTSPAATVEKLLRDPSLHNNERGKKILRLLHVNAVGAEQLSSVAATVPPHCVGIVARLARQYAKMWQDFAQELDGRVEGLGKVV